MKDQTDSNPRQEIEDAINAGDSIYNLHRLLHISGTLHGHFCPGSAMGVKAAARAMKELGVVSSWAWKRMWPSWRQTTVSVMASRW